MNFQLRSNHYKIVSDILKKYPFQFFVFGSRAKGYARELSDLDLLIDSETVTKVVLEQIREDFEESDLPFKVDIVRRQDIDDSFYEQIRSQLVPFEF